MRRLLVALSLALLASLAVAVGVATASHGTDYARGTVDQGSADWRFTATSNFNGTEPRGTIRLTFANEDPNLVLTADVTCLRVVDGLFEARGVVTDVRGGTTIINSLIIRGSDEGRFSTTRDTFAGLASLSTEPGPCALPTPGSPVQDGEIVVHDS
jgi:hypothetical protein